MHAFFKPVMILFVIFCIFAYVLVYSNTVETTTETYISRTGLKKQTTNFTFHWDRFGDYIKKTPERIKEALEEFNLFK